MSTVDRELIVDIVLNFSRDEMTDFISNIDEDFLWKEFETARQEECSNCLGLYHTEDLNWEGHCDYCQIILDEEEEDND